MFSFWLRPAEPSAPNPQPANEAKRVDSQAAYEKAVAEHKLLTKDWTPLYRHIWYVVDKKTLESSGASVGQVLAAMHSSGAAVKGSGIHFANADHRGSLGTSCPFTTSTDLKPSLHLGSTRVWKADGSIDETRWQELLEKASDKDKTIIPQQKFKAFLNTCAAKDPEEKETGRHVNNWRLFGWRSNQLSMADKAWDEIFTDLAGGWLAHEKGEPEPYLTVEVMRQFFEDSGLAYKRAEFGLLPVAKPVAPVVGFCQHGK